MIVFASLLIGNWNWVLPAILILVVGLVLVFRSYRGRLSGRAYSVAAAGLKLLGLLLLAVCLIDPLYSGVRARPGANLFAILVDNSSSLDVGQNEANPAKMLPEILSTDTPGWQTRMGQDFEVRRYEFDDSLHAVHDYRDLASDGNVSALEQSLRMLSERLQDRPLAGVLLFTDGNATDGGEGLPQTDGLPPIYPVKWGKSLSLPDIAITTVSVSQSPFEDAPVSVKAEVAAHGSQISKVTAEILDPQGERVAELTQQIEPDAEATPFRLQFKAPQLGVSFYRLRVAAEGAMAQFEDPAQLKEAALENNQRLLTIDRGAGGQRVLYVSGRPNWEFKFLRRALEDDEATKLTGLIRIAKREPKFKWRDGKTESSNPLFRGFTDGDAEETEQYDEPVFVRIDPRDPAELRDGFPKTAEQLFAFDALVLDDVEAELFTRDQLALIEDFVSRRGGSLLMMGGQESFRRGGYGRTPLQDLLPIYLDRGPAARPSGRFRLSLSRDGWLQPWVRLRRTEDEERVRISEMPQFWTLNPLPGVKPGATVLAEVSDQNDAKFPALVAQPFGRGKAAALAVGDFWRWSLRRKNHEQDDYARAVRQMFRWLIADVPRRVDVSVESEIGSGVVLEIRVRDAEFQPQDNAQVKLSVGPADGKNVTLTAEPSLNEPGLFTVRYTPRTAGAYRASITVNDGKGGESPPVAAGWVHAPDVEEFRRIGWNEPYLNRLAQETGGQIVEADDLEQFVAELVHQDAPVTERYTYPLWHQSSIFLLALSCFIGEWGLRRLRGLP